MNADGEKRSKDRVLRFTNAAVIITITRKVGASPLSPGDES